MAGCGAGGGGMPGPLAPSTSRHSLPTSCLYRGGVVDRSGGAVVRAAGGSSAPFGVPTTYNRLWRKASIPRQKKYKRKKAAHCPNDKGTVS